MTDKTEKNWGGKPFVKGDPRINRDGRPKGSGLNLTSLLKAKLEEIPEGQKKTYKAMFTEKLLHKALVDGDLQSLKLIMNYVDGLPKQSIDLSGEVAIPILQNALRNDDSNNEDNETNQKD